MEGGSRLVGTGKVDHRENPVAKEKAVSYASAVQERTDDVTSVADSASFRHARAGEIDRSQRPVTQQEAVFSVAVEEMPNDVAASIDSTSGAIFVSDTAWDAAQPKQGAIVSPFGLPRKANVPALVLSGGNS